MATDRAAAAWEFVPAYYRCTEQMLAKRRTPAEGAKAFADAIAPLLPLSPKAVGLFPASEFPLPSWQSVFARSPMLVVESEPIVCGGLRVKDALERGLPCTHCADCFNPAKDVVIPPVTRFEQVQRLRAFRTPPTETRRYVMCWHGQSAASTDEEDWVPTPRREIARRQRYGNQAQRFSDAEEPAAADEEEDGAEAALTAAGRRPRY